MGSVQNRKRQISNNSMECDCDKLEELQKRSESKPTMSGLGGHPSTLSSPSCTSELASSYVSTHSKLSESDEDTEDASEDETQSLKEQVYHEELTRLRDNLDQLSGGTHAEFNQRLKKLDEDMRNRQRLNKARRDYEVELIEQDHKNQEQLFLTEYEDKANEALAAMNKDLEEKKKQVEQERLIELDSEQSRNEPKTKHMSTRKLRRGIVSMPLHWLRRKAPVSQIKIQLEDKEIDEDLKFLVQHSLKDAVIPKSKDECPSSEATTDVDDDDNRSVSPEPRVHFDAKIQNGKLFYEKRWFHRGQPVFVEGNQTPKSSGVISAISNDVVVVWVQMLKSQNKFEIPISSIQNGDLVITRRAC